MTGTQQVNNPRHPLVKFSRLFIQSLRLDIYEMSTSSWQVDTKQISYPPRAVMEKVSIIMEKQKEI